MNKVKYNGLALGALSNIIQSKLSRYYFEKEADSRHVLGNKSDIQVFPS